MVSAAPCVWMLRLAWLGALPGGKGARAKAIGKVRTGGKRCPPGNRTPGFASMLWIGTHDVKLPQRHRANVATLRHFRPRPKASQMARAHLLRHLLYRSRILWRVAVHSLQPAVRVGKNRRHIHFATDDLDICSGFAGTRGLHGLVELAKCGHPRRVPIRASERPWQFGVVPRPKIVVGPVRIFFQRPLDQITAVVEDE